MTLFGIEYFFEEESDERKSYFFDELEIIKKIRETAVILFRSDSTK